jgi:hypothetical protein
VVSLTVVRSIGSLKVSTIGAVTDTPVAPLAGLALTTDGCVVLAVPEVPVAKLLVNDASEFPA